MVSYIKFYYFQILFEIFEKFNEINFGEWEGLSFDEFEKKYFQMYLMWKDNFDKVIFSGEGNLDVVMKRVKSFFDEIL